RSTTANFGGSGTGNIYGLEGGVQGGSVGGGGSYGVAAQMSPAPSPAYHASMGKSAGDGWGGAMDKTEDDGQARAVDEDARARRDVTAEPTSPIPPAHMTPPVDLKPEAKKAPAKDPADTPIATMRAEIGKCWAAPHGTLHVELDFDTNGVLTTA